MNDEPHSHKKVTVVVLAVFLLAYVGSYVGLRQNPSLHAKDPYKELHAENRVVVLEHGHWYVPSAEFLNHFYWPLKVLDYQATKTIVDFWVRSGPE